MMYPDPECFDRVKIAGHPDPFSGADSKGPWRVVGITGDWETLREEVIEGEFNNRQVAETWLRVYLERHVKDAYFGPRYIDC